MPWPSSSKVVRVTGDLRAQKREVLTGLASWMAGTNMRGVSPRIRRSPDALRITWEFANGVHGLLLVETLKQGVPTGAIALEPRLTITGGPLVAALDRIDLPPAPTWKANHQLLNADCHMLGGPTGTYVVRLREASGVVRAREDIEAILIPALEAFSGDWPTALDITLEHPAAVAFAAVTAAILIGWTGRLELVADLRERAGREQWLSQGMSTEALDQVMERWAFKRAAAQDG